MNDAYQTKLTVFGVIDTPETKNKCISLYTRDNIEDIEHARGIVKSMQDKNKGLKIFGELTSRWHIS